MRLKGIFERVDVSTDRILLALDSTQPTGMIRYELTAEIARALGVILTDRRTVYPRAPSMCRNVRFMSRPGRGW
jgi:hypothetical protein